MNDKPQNCVFDIRETAGATSVRKRSGLKKEFIIIC